MLSEEAIDNLIEPFIRRQEELNMYVVEMIAKAIKRTGEITPAQMNQLERLYKTGSDVRKINKELARVSGLQVSSIKKLISTIALDGYKDSKPFFDYRKKPFIPFSENRQLQRVVKTIANQTAKEYTNLSKAQAFMLRDPKNPKKLIPTPAAKAYQQVLDQAIQAVQSGAVSYNVAMRKVLDELSDSGLRVVYQAESGKIHSQRMDVAVRRNLLDGVKAINQGVQDEVGKEFGADGKEISVHRYSAPDHEPIQGHQFSNTEYEKLQSEKPFKDALEIEFKPIRRKIGTWNCRHFTYSVILGHSKPVHSLEELQKYIDENQKGYTLPNGRHLTMYECTQEQRRYEREIRRAKQEKMISDAAGNSEKAAKAAAKVSRLTKEYKEFSKACGLSIKPDRIQVRGYTQKVSAKS